MKPIATSFTVALALAVAACASAPLDGAPGSDPEPSTNVTADPVGSVAARLTLAGGDTLSSAQWTIRGGGGSAYVRTGSVNLDNSQAIAFVVGDVPVGSGYQIAVSGSVVGGGVTCDGSAPFNIAAGQTSQANLLLACITAPVAPAPATTPGALAALALALAGAGAMTAGKRRAPLTSSKV